MSQEIDELEKAFKSIDEQLKKIQSEATIKEESKPISEEKVKITTSEEKSGNISSPSQFEKVPCKYKKFIPDDPDADFKFKFDVSKSEYTYYCLNHFKVFISSKPQGKSDLDFLISLYELIPITQKGMDFLKDLGYYSIKKETKIKEEKTKPSEDQMVNAIKKAILKALKKPIILKQTDLENQIKELEEFKNKRITSAFNSAIEELVAEENVLDIDLDSKNYVKYVNFISLKFDKRIKKFYALKKEFERDFEKLTTTKEKEIIKESEEKETKPKKKAKAEPEETEEFEIPYTTYSCSVDEENNMKFPDLSGIYNHFPNIYEYFIEKGVIINEILLRKMLLAIERDKPFILYGEPGDGKSLIIKTFLDYIAYEYNGGENKIEGKEFTKPKNPFIKNQLKFPYGNYWKSMNVDESTNPLSLFGGFSPESIGGGAEMKLQRKKTTELGIISECVKNGWYCFLDEMNRTENEVLGRLMGFLEEPYSYEVPEGKFKFLLKNPNSIDKRYHRSNFILCATMNIGDVGNFKMSFAFKRRFKIIQVHYTTEEIKNIIRKTRGWDERTNKGQLELDDLRNKWNLLKAIEGSDFSELKDKIKSMLDNISEAIFVKTHDWKTARFTTFGVGVAHIMTVLADLSLFIQDLILRKYIDENISVINETKFNTASEKGDLYRAVTDAVDENIIMSLVDENDRYKLESLNTPKAELIKSIHLSISNVIQWIHNNMTSSYLESKISEVDVFRELIMGIFKWSKIKFET